MQHEIMIYSSDENGKFTKKIREGIQEELDITYKLLPPIIQKIYECWCNECREDDRGCKETLTMIFNDLEYIFIDNYWD